ncbi:MAG: hypothetical protein Q7R76_06870 [Candidatus Woesearchaeota archaeon]|nr:hypothetical protein [Candidatus Woesearchaeota archaeon]
MADEENQGTDKQRKSRVLVAMNYVLILVIVVGIGMVLFKKPAASDNGLAITGSAPADVWCQTHTTKADCEKVCDGTPFDAYATCTADCFKRLDECKK